MQIIDEKGEYRLVVDTSIIDDQLGYQVINNKYGVVEAETRILPQALKFLEDLSAALDVQIELIAEDNAKPAPGTVVELPLRGK